MDNSDLKVFLGDCRKKYKQAKVLLDLDEEYDLTEPFKAKYEASEILHEIHSSLNMTSKDFRFSLLSALMKYEIGRITFETDEMTNCESCYDECLEILKGHELKPECIVLSISVLNGMAMVWSSREEHKKAGEYLKRAEMMYGDYKLGNNSCPFDFNDLFEESEAEKVENWEPLEKVLTMTLYYLAQVYEKVHESKLSAKYCHMTLKRQFLNDDFVPYSWCLNCATLSHYYALHKKFWVARHLLACATRVITEDEGKLADQPPNAEAIDNVKRCKADISRCWAFYAVELLDVSEKVKSGDLTQGLENLHLTEQNLDAESKACRLLPEDDVRDYENQITFNLVSSYDNARPVFLFGIKHLQEGKRYYVLDEYTSNYVQIVQQNSKFYKLLASFEGLIDRKCKMHKRRISMLEELVEELNPQYYLTLCQQLLFELGETYGEMMDLKISDTVDKPENTNAINKINYLVSRGIDKFAAFLDTFRDSNKDFPATLADEAARPVLLAHFCLARLHTKFILPRSQREIEYLKTSEKLYKCVINYVKKNPQHEHVIEEELAIAQEMVQLIPAKIATIAVQLM